MIVEVSFSVPSHADTKQSGKSRSGQLLGLSDRKFYIRMISWKKCPFSRNEYALLLRRQAMIFWLLSCLTSSKLPSVPPFPEAPGSWDGGGNCGAGGPQLFAGWLSLGSLPTLRKNNDKFVPGGHPGSREICFGLSMCLFFFLPGTPFVRRTVRFFCCWGFV